MGLAEPKGPGPGDEFEVKPSPSLICCYPYLTADRIDGSCLTMSADSIQAFLFSGQSVERMCLPSMMEQAPEVPVQQPEFQAPKESI
jgi:hypothetical protein